MPPIFDKLLKPKAIAASAVNQFDALVERAKQSAAALDFETCVRLYDEALTLKPADAETYYKRGNALNSLGELSSAIDSFDQAIDLRPDYAHAFCNRGTAQQSLGMTDAALYSYDRAISLDPSDAIAHYNRALLMQECEQWSEAVSCYDRALKLNPSYTDALYNRSLALLFQGDFERGWLGYEWRWKNAHRLSIIEPRHFSQPLWLGKEDISGKRLLIYAEAGLGDTLQFCRYAKLCAELGATVILEVQSALREVIANLKGVSQLVVRKSELPPFDYQCPLMSLPLAFNTRLDSIPATTTAYLDCNKGALERWQRVLGAKKNPRIGLAWSGNPKNTIDQKRSVRLAEWTRHLPVEYDYFCLQTPVREADQVVLDSSSNIFSFDEHDLDFVNTAALCKCMDLVVSVDTSIAHLSGALGQLTWTLLPFTPDWRWMQHRNDTPWYPSMKLYRQSTPGEWGQVFDRVASDLRKTFQVTDESSVGR